jgi:DNA-directed RNA polymerase specialized sigma24 family protein
MSKPSAEPRNGSFPQTRWSLVLDAQDDNPEALAELCRAYWFPLYCYARRLRPDTEDAKDLTQAFFETLLTRDSLKLARKDRGKLRSFLLTSLKNFSLEQHRKGQAQKRGGAAPHISFDGMEAEQRFVLEPRHEVSPELEFDRAWARELLARVLAKLGDTYHAAGKRELFALLQPQLMAGDQAAGYSDAGAKLGLSAAAMRYAAFKLRERYREMLKEAIHETVTNEVEAAEELAHLRGLFGT